MAVIPPRTPHRRLCEQGIDVLPIGNDANSYLGQLLAAGCVDSEKIFYVKDMKGTREGDNIYSTPGNLLEKGENGFGYVMLKGDEPLSSPGKNVPIVVAPLLTGGADPTFDPKPFKGQYIYLTPDGAVSGGEISKAGRPLTRERSPRVLFESGKNSVFGTDIPDVKIPR